MKQDSNYLFFAFFCYPYVWEPAGTTLLSLPPPMQLGKTLFSMKLQISTNLLLELVSRTATHQFFQGWLCLRHKEQWVQWVPWPQKKYTMGRFPDSEASRLISRSVWPSSCSFANVRSSVTLKHDVTIGDLDWHHAWHDISCCKSEILPNFWFRVFR